MRRSVYLLGVGLALVGLALPVTEALLWRPAATPENARRVRLGMTAYELEAILGPPDEFLRREGPGWHFPAPLESRHADLKAGRGGAMRWVPPDDRVGIWVLFDHKGRAEHIEVYLDPDDPGPFARLRAWLGW